MSGGSASTGGYYYLEEVTWTCFFYSGYALHTAYWHDAFGPAAQSRLRQHESVRRVVGLSVECTGRSQQSGGVRVLVLTGEPRAAEARIGDTRRYSLTVAEGTQRIGVKPESSHQIKKTLDRLLSRSSVFRFRRHKRIFSTIQGKGMALRLPARATARVAPTN